MQLLKRTGSGNEGKDETWLNWTARGVSPDFVKYHRPFLSKIIGLKVKVAGFCWKSVISFENVTIKWDLRSEFRSFWQFSEKQSERPKRRKRRRFTGPSKISHKSPSCIQVQVPGYTSSRELQLRNYVLLYWYHSFARCSTFPCPIFRHLWESFWAKKNVMKWWNSQLFGWRRVMYPPWN